MSVVWEAMFASAASWKSVTLNGLFSLALASVPVASQAATTVAVAGDTFIQGSSTNTTNHGNNSNITVKNTGSVSSTSRIGYLHFNIGATPDPIAYASLSLTAVNNDAPTTGGNWVVQVYGLATESLDNWSETTLNWTNSPGHNADSYGFNSDAVFLGSFNVSPGALNQTVSFDSANNAALLNFLNADTDGRVTFMLNRTTAIGATYNLGFASRDYINPSGQNYHPSLTFDTVPEPSRSTLTLAAAAVLFLRRKRLCV